MIKVTERTEPMTVGELISCLQKLNEPDAQIRASYDAGCASGEVRGLQRAKNGYKIIVH